MLLVRKAAMAAETMISMKQEEHFPQKIEPVCITES